MSYKKERRRGVVFQSQEDQDLCSCTVVEELICSTSSEDQTVDLSNSCPGFSNPHNDEERDLQTKPIHECRCDERLKSKGEEST
jgi:hypothetical protein